MLTDDKKLLKKYYKMVDEGVQFLYVFKGANFRIIKQNSSLRTLGYIVKKDDTVLPLASYIRDNPRRWIPLIGYFPKNSEEAVFLLKMGFSLHNTPAELTVQYNSDTRRYIETRHIIAHTFSIPRSTLDSILELKGWIVEEKELDAEKTKGIPEKAIPAVGSYTKRCMEPYFPADMLKAVQKRMSPNIASVQFVGSTELKTFKLSPFTPTLINIKEASMFEITTPTLINGTDVKTLSETTLIEYITKIEDQVASLKKVKVKSVFITNRLTKLKALTVKLASLLDSKVETS